MSLVLLVGTLSIALLWFLRRLIHAPWDSALRAVTACVGLMILVELVGWYARVAAAHTSGQHGFFKLVENLLLMGAYWCLMLFFLFSAAGPRARRRARWELLPLVSGMALMTTAMVFTPDQYRDHVFTTAEMRIPGIAAFYFVGTVYYVYVMSLTARWAWQYGAESHRWVRIGLHLAALGLLLRVLATGVRVVFIGIRFAGGTVPAQIDSSMVSLLNIGGAVFVVGVLSPGVVTLLTALQGWWQHRRAYHELRPLWERLHEVFSEDTLDRALRALWWERISPRHIHRRYWRRVVEIRDGLVQLSPHLADLGYSPHQPLRQQSALLERALQRQRDGVDSTSCTAVLVAAPESPDLDLHTDVDRLLQLARTLSEAAPSSAAAAHDAPP